MLLDNGAQDLLDVTATSKDPGDTPLHKVAWFVHGLADARLLVDRGARVNLRNENGQTPYHLARTYTPSVAKYLPVVATWARRTSAGNTSQRLSQRMHCWDSPGLGRACFLAVAVFKFEHWKMILRQSAEN
jgi:hypothetical protein